MQRKTAAKNTAGETSPPVFGRSGRLPVLFLLVFLLLLCLFGCSEEPCEHSFTVLKKEERYQMVPATCYNYAVYYLCCAKCGKSARGLDESAVFVDSDSGYAHRPGEWTVAQEPDDLHSGWRYCSCTVCGKLILETLPVPHTYHLKIVAPPDKTEYRAFQKVSLTGIDARLVCSDCGHMASIPSEDLTLLTGGLHAGDNSFSVSYHDGEKTYCSEEIPITVTRAAHVVYNWEEDTLLCCDSLFSHFPKSSAENIPITVTVRDSAGNEVDPDARLPEGEYEITGVIEETEDFERWETTVPFSVCHFIEYSSSWPHVYGHIPGPTWTEAWEKCKFCDHIDAVYIFMDGIPELSSDLELLLPYEVTEVISVTFDGTEIPGAFTEPLEPNKFYERTALRTEGEALLSLPDGAYRVLVTGKARTALNFWYEDNPVYYLEVTIVLRH